MNACATGPKANAPPICGASRRSSRACSKRVAALRPLPLPLIAAMPRLRAAIDALINEIQREGAHDPDRDP